MAAERGYHVDGEERHPAEQEDAHDDPERDSRLVLRHPARHAAAASRRTPRGQSRVCGYPVVDDQRRLGVVAGPVDGLGVPASVAVQSVVEEGHGDARQIEANHRRHNGVDRTQIEHTLCVIDVVVSGCRRRLVAVTRDPRSPRDVDVIHGGLIHGGVLVVARGRGEGAAMPAELDRKERDQSGHHPDETDGGQHSSMCH